MTRTCRIYGEAIFDLAVEMGKLREFLEELELVCLYLKAESEYAYFLDAPSISVQERCGALERVFGDRLSESVLSLVLFLCKKGQIRNLCRIYEVISEMARVVSGGVLCKITSAVELSQKEKKALCLAIEKRLGKRADISFFIDKTLIGGIILETDGKIYDGSLKRKLAEIKEIAKK